MRGSCLNTLNDKYNNSIEHYSWYDPKIHLIVGH